MFFTLKIAVHGLYYKSQLLYFDENLMKKDDFMRREFMGKKKKTTTASSDGIGISKGTGCLLIGLLLLVILGGVSYLGVRNHWPVFERVSLLLKELVQTDSSHAPGDQALEQGSNSTMQGLLKTNDLDPFVTVKNPTGAPATLYFTPDDSSWATQEHPLVSALLASIRDARDSIDICMTEFSDKRFADALLDAAKRGVKIRLVTDNEGTAYAAIRRLAAAPSIQIRDDQRESWMRNQFLIVDGLTLWTGSMNLSTRATQDISDVMNISSPLLANAFLQKFDEYWNGKFGVHAISPLRKPNVKEGEFGIEVLFAPANNIQAKILNELGYAKKKVHMMATTLTNDAIIEKLKELARKNVEIVCLLDSGAAGMTFSQDDYLRGLGIRLVILPDGRKLNSNLILIDDSVALAGTYAYNKSAGKFNDENLLLIRSVELVTEYERYFQHHRK